MIYLARKYDMYCDNIIPRGSSPGYYYRDKDVYAELYYYCHNGIFSAEHIYSDNNIPRGSFH